LTRTLHIVQRDGLLVADEPQPYLAQGQSDSLPWSVKDQHHKEAASSADSSLSKRLSWAERHLPIVHGAPLQHPPIGKYSTPDNRRTDPLALSLLRVGQAPSTDDAPYIFRVRYWLCRPTA